MKEKDKMKIKENPIVYTLVPFFLEADVLIIKVYIILHSKTLKDSTQPDLIEVISCYK